MAGRGQLLHSAKMLRKGAISPQSNGRKRRNLSRGKSSGTDIRAADAPKASEADFAGSCSLALDFPQSPRGQFIPWWEEKEEDFCLIVGAFVPWSADSIQEA